MGFVKQKWEESLAPDWLVPDKYVCVDCVEDDFLKNIIAENLAEQTCDYCGQGGEESIVAPVKAIMGPICSAFFYYFNDPENAGVPYAGGYVFEPKITAQDALATISLECHDDLFEDVANSFGNELWVETAGGHWASSHPSDIMSYAWARFVQQVKHEVRFFFSTITPVPHDYEYYSPTNTLADIGNAVKDLGMIQSLPESQAMYRVRERSPSSTWTLDADQLGAPPNELAQTQRMNPAGISYLYLAKEKETALAEVLNKPPCRAAIATFVTRRDLLVIDLSQLTNIPSVFDAEKRSKGELIQFLYQFVHEISMPVTKDGREHIDYVPSQVVCEYFAKVFKTVDGNRIDGIAYPSSIRRGGINVVLFPPKSSQKNGFNDLVELTTAEEVTFEHRGAFTDAIR